MEQHPSSGKLYRGENFLADVLCNISRRPGGLVGEVSIVAGDQDLKPNEELVIHMPDGRKAFCMPSRALASGAWIVQISRIDE
jgi:hypothetical protein